MDDCEENETNIDESYVHPKKSTWIEVQTPGKRIRIGSSPEMTKQTPARPSEYIQPHLPQSQGQQQLADPSGLKIPPITVRFESGKPENDREIGADLVNVWQTTHNRKLNITVRFSYMNCLLVFANDSITFEDLMVQSHWPPLLKGLKIKIQLPRTLPSEYSIVIRQFHKNWIESEVEQEMRTNYPSLVKLTLMFVKEGTPLNLVWADFHSISLVKQLLLKQVIYIGQLEHPIKPYHAPVRVEKCRKCHSHEHATATYQGPQICMRCSQQHSFKDGCSNEIKCANCGQSHYAGHSACPHVQKKRREIADKNALNRAQLLVRASQMGRHQYQYVEQEFPTNRMPGAASPPAKRQEQPNRNYANVVIQQSVPTKVQRGMDSVEHMLSSCLANIEQRLREFETRLLSQVCDIERKIDMRAECLASMECAVYDLILPTIRQLTTMIQTSGKQSTSSTKSDLAKIDSNIESAMKCRVSSMTAQNHRSPSPLTPLASNNGT